MFYSKGGIPLEKIERIPFDEYLIFLKEALKIQEILTKEPKKLKENIEK